MTSDDLSNERVAHLLKQDAKASSARYAAVGLSAFLPKRDAGQAPKPNTRFLRNVLRETDSHNAALLAKEAEESRARLRAMRRAGEEGRGEGRSMKRRRVGEEEEEGTQKRKWAKAWGLRVEGGDRERDSKRRSRSKQSRHSQHSRRDDKERDGRRRSRSRSRHGRDKARSSRAHRRRRSSERSDSSSESERRQRKRERHRRRRRSRSPSRSPSEEDTRRKRRSRKRRSRSESSDRSLLDRKTTTHNRRSTDDAHLDATSENGHGAGDYSDPLEDIVGPMPPQHERQIKLRGRGAFKSSPGIDARFASNYDPTTDVQLDLDAAPDGTKRDDWDMALEALKDRQRWKQMGAERMRSAGFTDEQVRKWERGGEKNEEDVRWAKKGEGREWDRGKVVEEDGCVGLKADWGRLKGT